MFLEPLGGIPPRSYPKKSDDKSSSCLPCGIYYVPDRIDPPKKMIWLFQIARTRRVADGDNAQAPSPAVVFTDVVTRLIEEGLEANLVGLMKGHLAAKPPPSLVRILFLKISMSGFLYLSKLQIRSLKIWLDWNVDPPVAGSCFLFGCGYVALENFVTGP
jgi:hypothetical protein